MDTKRILALKSSFADVTKSVQECGIDYWMARDLMPLLGYSRWENFVEAISRAKMSCNTQGIDISYHFRDVAKMMKPPISTE